MPESAAYMAGYNIGYVIGSVGSLVFLVRMMIDAFRYVHKNKIQRRKVVYIILCSLRGIWFIVGLLS